jgi:hypothetical protein
MALVAVPGSWVAVDAASGRDLWAVPAGGPAAFTAPMGEARLLAGDDRSGALIDATDGRVLERVPAGPVAVVSRAGAPVGVLAVDDDRTVGLDPSTGAVRAALADAEAARGLAAGALYTMRAGTLSAYDLATLRPQWSQPVDVPRGQVPSIVYRGRPVVVHDGGRRLLAYG